MTGHYNSFKGLTSRADTAWSYTLCGRHFLYGQGIRQQGPPRENFLPRTIVTVYVTGKTIFDFD